MHVYLSQCRKDEKLLIQFLDHSLLLLCQEAKKKKKSFLRYFLYSKSDSFSMLEENNFPPTFLLVTFLHCHMLCTIK